MKRIVLLVCGMLLLVANSAEARRSRSNGRYYTQPATYNPVLYNTPAPQPARVAAATSSKPIAHEVRNVVASSPETKPVVTVARSTSTTKVATVAAKDFSTRTAQGVANIMASRGMVGHFGGNPGYEGCGMAATPEAAYNTCCYANSGMATVDVGYAQGANGMWYCCRRYR
jgi:hypothetical protein